MRKTKLSLLVAAQLLAACTVGPDYRRPEFFADGALQRVLITNPNATESVSRRWYEIFDDPNLNCLIEQALAQNTDVKVALQRLREARFMLFSNEAQFLPNLDAAGGYTYSYLSNGKNRPRLTEDYYKAGLDASWEIDIWGGGRRLNESSRALLQASADNLAAVRLSLTAEVAGDYMQLRNLQYQWQIADENLQLQQEIFATVRQKYEAGLADETALNQAQYAVEGTKALLPQLEQQMEVYHNALALLLGVLPDEIAGTEAPEDNPMARRFYFDFNHLYDFPLSVVRNRPDVRAAESNLVAKNAAIGQAVAAMFPSVSLGATLGWQTDNFSQLGSSGHAAYGYAPNANLPLFNFGRLYHQVQAAEAVKEQYLYMYKNALLTAVQDIKNSVTAVKKEYQRNLSLQKSAENMQQVVELMSEQYRQGLIEFSDLLASEQNLLAAENKLAVSNGAIYQNIIAFYKSIGGGY